MDLANAVLRESYRKHTDIERLSPRSMLELRSAIAHSKRFVLDASMSAFMADLSTVPFKVAQERRPDVLSSLRHSAVPPFPKMFVQIDNFAFRNALLAVSESKTDAWGQELVTPYGDNIVRDIGWLIEQSDDKVHVTEFFNGDKEGEVMSLPFHYIYSLSDKGITDGPFGGRWFDTKAAMFAHGITNLYDNRFAIVYHQPLDSFPNTHVVDVDDEERGRWRVSRLVVEFGGILRYVLCFLATLNDVPKIQTEVRPQKGFLGGGQIRKYLDYTTLTLHLPQRTTRINLAKRLIAKARRGWHEVRPHWRIMHPVLQGTYCASRSAHLWNETDSSGHATCMQCDAKRMWIILPTGRGDPTISVRTHKYIVTHPKD